EDATRQSSGKPRQNKIDCGVNPDQAAAIQRLAQEHNHREAITDRAWRKRRVTPTTVSHQ
ncbi:MAG: hypothetical protein WAU27_13215, partial [Pseudomonadales bacterium]